MGGVIIVLYDNMGPLGLGSFEIPDETGRKKKRDRLVITGGLFGPQLMLFHNLEGAPEEEDPNP